jgi:hypothetical protein
LLSLPLLFCARSWCTASPFFACSSTSSAPDATCSCACAYACNV